jgi:hypothetical protein
VVAAMISVKMSMVITRVGAITSLGVAVNPLSSGKSRNLQRYFLYLLI